MVFFGAVWFVKQLISSSVRLKSFFNSFMASFFSLSEGAQRIIATRILRMAVLNDSVTSGLSANVFLKCLRTVSAFI